MEGPVLRSGGSHLWGLGDSVGTRGTRLAGKTAIITGAGSGIGRASASLLFEDPTAAGT